MPRPTDDEIRKQYNLPSDIPILDTPPSEKEIGEKGFLIKIGEVFGLQGWMWKSWQGIVLAILIVPPAVYGVYSFWKPIGQYAYTNFPKYLESFQPPEKSNDNRYIAFLPDTQEAIDSKKYKTPDLYPIGTGVFPVSGSKFG
ncbi:MAG: hypothetical protein HY298_19445 [Verrucomicrobia bacterium]|nr:hypothetical protein [Verrucomicrobiota bacterium]